MNPDGRAVNPGVVVGLGNPGERYCPDPAQRRVHDGRPTCPRCGRRRVASALAGAGDPGFDREPAGASGQAADLHEPQRRIRRRAGGGPRDRSAGHRWSCSTMSTSPSVASGCGPGVPPAGIAGWNRFWPRWPREDVPRVRLGVGEENMPAERAEFVLADFPETSAPESERHDGQRRRRRRNDPEFGGGAGDVSF